MNWKSEQHTADTLAVSDKARDAYLHSDPFTRSIIESSRDCIKVLSLEGELLWISDTGQKMLCISDLSQVIGKSWIDFWQTSDRESARHAVSEAAQGRSATFIGHYRVCDAARWWEVIVSPILDITGQPEQLLAVSRNVTARLQVSEDLEKALARLTEQAHLLDLSADAIISRDLEGRILFWNVGAEKMYGWTQHEARGKIIHDFLKSKFSEPFAQMTEKLLRTGSWRGEIVHTRKDGTTLTVFSRKELARDDQGRPVSVLESNTDITEHKRAEEAVRQSAALFEKAISAPTVGVLFFNLDGRIHKANEAFERMSGYTSAELVNISHWRVLTAPDSWASTEETAAELAERGVVAPYEKEMIRKDGSHWWGLFAPTGLSGSGWNRQCVEFIIDISERKSAEQRLRENEELFRTLSDNISQLAWMTNPDGWIFWYNKRWYDYTGTDFEQMKGWGWQKVHHPDLVGQVTEKFKRAIESGQPWEDTFPLRGADGQYRWFLSRASPIRDTTGKIVRWFGSNTDVTELRRAEAELRENEAILRTVTTEARVGLVIIDKNRRYTYANRTYAEMHGLADPNIIGKRVPDVLARIYDQIAPHMNRAFAGERASFELHVPSSAASPTDHIFEIVYEPRISDPSNPYVVVVIFDITERKQTQETLEKAVAARTSELRESNEQLEALVYSIAHDLRAPLRAMQGYSDILLDDARISPEQSRTYLQRINTSAEAMDKMILDLLAFGRIARADIQLTPVEVEDVWEAALRQTSREIEQTHANIQVTSPLLTVRAHKATLTQILANLLSNALKFVEPNKTPEIRFHCELNGEYIRLSLQDNGIGIEPQYHNRIFRVFERLEGAKYPGTGIGLSIVRKGIERMNGQFGLESQLGHGARFWLDLPKP